MTTTYRKWMAALSTLVMAITCTAGATVEEPVPEGNLLKNPGFEIMAASGCLSNWGGGEFGKFGDSVMVDDKIKRSGQNSLRITFRPLGWITCASEKMLLKANTRYIISWWVKTENMVSGSKVYAFFQFEGNSPPKQIILKDSEWAVNADWVRFATEYIAPARDEWAQLVFVSWGGTQQTNKTASAWFDDASIAKAPPNVELSPSVCPLKHGTWEALGELTDEFEGQALDRKKWSVDQWAWSDPGYSTYFSTNNVSVSNGCLHLALRKEPVNGCAYTSGFVRSLAVNRYGYFEAKCRLTKAAADNAFWFCNGENDGFGYSEIDILEASAAAIRRDGTAEPDANKVGSTLHNTSLVDRNCWNAGCKIWQAPTAPALDKEFHRYGLEWNEDYAVIYFDGEAIQVIENTHNHFPLKLMFNLTTSVRHVRDEDIPSVFDIEYVRAWKRTDVEDKRIQDFKFSLPDRNQQYRVRTADNGTLVIFTIGGGSVKVDYQNPDFFNSQKDAKIRKTVAAKDKNGKAVNFNFEWHWSALDVEHNGYKPYRLDIEPAEKRPKGSAEAFVFVAENGQEVRLTIVY